MMAASEQCPKCGEEFDAEKYEIIDCPECFSAGSTRCCNSGGRGCVCAECEEGGGDE